MNPPSDQPPGLGLPQPSFDLGQVPVQSTPAAFRPPETPATVVPAPMVSPLPSGPPPAAIQPMPAVAPQPQPLPIAGPSAVQDIPVLQNDEDNSEFDKEWVAKAREAVERTHTDPYAQSREISRLKAQYIKARYNKDIKISEDRP